MAPCLLLLQVAISSSQYIINLNHKGKMMKPYKAGKKKRLRNLLKLDYGNCSVGKFRVIIVYLEEIKE